MDWQANLASIIGINNAPRAVPYFASKSTPGRTGRLTQNAVGDW